MPKSNGRPKNRQSKTPKKPNEIRSTTFGAAPQMINQRCYCGGKITRFGYCYSCGAPEGMSALDLAKRQLETGVGIRSLR